MAMQTDGPWEVVQQPSEVLVWGGGVAVAVVRPYDMVRVCTSLSDAHLIAAAPDLLHELEELVALIAVEYPQQQRVWLEAARNAIAKAKGELITSRSPTVGERGVW